MAPTVAQGSHDLRRLRVHRMTHRLYEAPAVLQHCQIGCRRGGRPTFSPNAANRIHPWLALAIPRAHHTEWWCGAFL